MKKSLFSTLFVAIALLLGINAVFGQQFKIGLTEGSFVINRVDSLIWIDVYVANDSVVKDISFDVLSYAHGGNSTLKSVPIPARPVKTDGVTTDATKWTAVTRLTDSTSSFHYWTADVADHWLPKSTTSRKIMEFFVKATNDIPLYGFITIKFSNFKVLGVDGGKTFYLTTPTETSITINLGAKPPDEPSDSVKVRVIPMINRSLNQAKFILEYKTKHNLTNLGFVLGVPPELSNPQVALTQPQAGRQIVVNKLNSANGFDYYQVTLSAAADVAFGSSPNLFISVAEINFQIDQRASGVKTIQTAAWQARGLVGESLKTGPDFNLVIDLGGAPPDFNYTIQFSVDRSKLEAYLDFYYTGQGFDSLAFVLKVPDKIVPTAIVLANVQGRSAITSLGNNNYLINIVLARVADSVMMSTKFMRLVLSFDASVVGQQALNFSGVSVKWGDLAMKVPGSFTLIVDFGQNPQPAFVKYFLTKAAPSWISSVAEMRLNGRGLIELFWWMDNTTETTGAINFDVVLPTYMSLSRVEPLLVNGQVDASKLVSFRKLGEANGLATYRAVYSLVNTANPLLPNPPTNNPRVIMKLVIDFTDLPPWTLTFWVKNIVASGLNGRVINQTKEMSLDIDFLKDVYGQFTKGDLQQFGDGQLTPADIDILIKIITREIVPTLYQLWAADMNGDGKIDAADLTILQDIINGPSAVDDFDNEVSWQLKGKIIEYQLNYATSIRLLVYDYSGQLRWEQFSSQASGQFDLSNLSDGVYWFSLNGLTGKVLLEK